MSEDAKLFLLKDRLSQIRRTRTLAIISTWVTLFFISIGLMVIFYAVPIEMIVIFGVINSAIIVSIIHYYYDREEKKLLLQIEQMANK